MNLSKAFNNSRSPDPTEKVNALWGECKNIGLAPMFSSKEKKILKMLMTSNIYLKLIMVSRRVYAWTITFLDLYE